MISHIGYLIVFLLINISIALLIYGQNAQCQNASQGKPSLSVATENQVYFPRDPINISGSVYDSKGFPVQNNSVTIKVTPYDLKNQVVYERTILTGRNGAYLDEGLRLSGGSEYDFLRLLYHKLFGVKENDNMSTLFSQKYNVSARTEISGVVANSWTQLEIKGYFLTFSAIMLYAGLADLLLLLIVLAIPSKRNETWMLIKKVLIFVFISGITLSPIASLFLTDSEVGINSPIGLIKKPIQDDQVHQRNEWVINIGGRLVNNEIVGGVQIPIYIFIFGIAGGYLRYLYDTAKSWGEGSDVKKEGSDVNDDRLLFYHSLGRLAIIFISPLLAIAIWFVLFQGGTTSSHTLAAVGITVGLLMNEVVKTITGFASNLFKTVRDESKGLGEKESRKRIDYIS